MPLRMPIARLAFALALCFAAPAFAAEPLPPPRIVVLDKVAIMQSSKVGQDIARQVKLYADQAERDLQGQSNALDAQAQSLQQQAAALAPADRQKRFDAVQAQEQALDVTAHAKDDQIQAGFRQAREAVEQALGPILADVMRDMGADIVLDKQSVVSLRLGSYDITPDVIARLDAKMPNYKVSIAVGAPPPAQP
jgi:Skp family chaperone for outer membrane proteins